MTEGEIIDGVIQREGGFVDHPEDKGGPTKFGINAETLGNWRGYGRVATREEVMALEVWEARAIYKARYVLQPGFTAENVAYEPLRNQLIDFGVNSDPRRAVRWLQRVLRTVYATVNVTGALDIPTCTALRRLPQQFLPLVNDAFCAARLSMLDSATDSGTISKTFEEGLESRALKFIVTRE